MTVGRKPTPTRLKVITGNPGKRPINKDEPAPPITAPIKPPANLSKAAKAEYRRVAKQLQPLGLLTDIDHAALALYAEAYATWAAASAQVMASGMVQTTPTGYVQVSPHATLAANASKRMQSLLAEFGMTPASRTRVAITLPPAPNEFDDL